jgi:hypothetical protein
MRLLVPEDTSAITDLYSQASRHANSVGHIDWPNPINEDFASGLIATNALFGWDNNQGIDGALLATTSPNAAIWNDLDGQPSALYLAKIATSNTVRGQGFFEAQMLPDVRANFSMLTPIRLDCLADNEKLKLFYASLGFVAVEDTVFYSIKQGREIAVTKFELVP